MLSFREAFARMVEHTFLRKSVSVHPNDLCVSSGCGAVVQNLMLCLLNHGEGVILPAPYYPAFDNDISVIAGGVLIPAPTEEVGYKIRPAELEAAYQGAVARGIVPRVLLLTNPSNPLGIIFSEQEMRDAILWYVVSVCSIGERAGGVRFLALDRSHELGSCVARRRAMTHDLHVVSDEIYANSVYDEARCGVPFRAAIEVAHNAVAALRAAEEASAASSSSTSSSSAPAGSSVSSAALQTFVASHLHSVWGLSKDFGVSGFRVGVLHTQSRALLKALDNIGYFTTASNDTQHAMKEVLSDLDFVTRFLDESHARMRRSRAALEAAAERDGIDVLPSGAAMFAWLDLRAYLDEPTFEAEDRLQARLFDECRILFVPGRTCKAAEPGFFRCCFTFMGPESVATGFERLGEFAIRHRTSTPVAPHTPKPIWTKESAGSAVASGGGGSGGGGGGEGAASAAVERE